MVSKMAIKKLPRKEPYQTALCFCVSGLLVTNYLISEWIEELPPGWPLFALLGLTSIAWVLVGYRFMEYQQLVHTEKESAEE